MSILSSVSYYRSFFLILLLSWPLIIQAGTCIDPNTIVSALGQLQEVLMCLEAKIDQQAKDTETVTVRYMPGLPKPTVSKSGYLGAVEIGLRYCKRQGTKVTCKFTLTNEGSDRNFKIYNAFVFDEFSKSYKASRINIMGGRGGAKILLTNIPADVTITFVNIATKATRFARMNINKNHGRSDNIEFRDIVIR